tara:strand:- start:5 stop:175 length:171 start_codon:yes stop_codon:yes gene_type:complete
MINTVEKIYYLNNFVSYELTLDNGLVKSVPLDEANTDYQEIQQWISEGNTVIDNGE